MALLVALAAACPTLALPDVERARALDDEDRCERVNEGAGDPIDQLLAHYVRVHEALEEAWSAAPACASLARERFDQQIAAAGTVLSYAWQWHGEVRGILRPRTTRAHRDLFAASWTALMSAALLLRTLESCRDDGAGLYDPWPFALLMRADENAYVRALAGTRGRAIIALSAEPVGRYSVRTWLYAFDALVEMRGHTGWTPASAEYFGALLMRYALLLRTDADDGTPAEVERIYNHPTLCRTASAPLPVPPGAFPLPRHLAQPFLFGCERRVYFAMRHNAAALNFYRTRTERAHPRSNTWRIQALRALVAFVHAMATNTLMRTMVIDSVRGAMMGRHVLPGESEAVAFSQQLGPGKMPDADTVLYEMRRDTFMALQPLQKAPLGELIERWANATIAALEQQQQQQPADNDVEWELVAALRPAGERAAVMVVERCLDVWLDFSTGRTFSLARQSYVDDASREPPHDCPPMSPDTALAACGGRAPVFVAIAQLYACVDWTEPPPPLDAMDVDADVPAPRRPRVVASPHFVDALADWFAAAVDLQRLPESAIHSTLRALLA